MVQDARKAAIEILDRLGKNDGTLNHAIERVLTNRERMTKRDRAFLYSLVYGVLRWRGRLDWIISYFSKTPMGKIEFRLLNVLRIAVFQIIFLDKVPDSAAVNTAVEISKSISPHWAPRFVNGLLRTIARRCDDVPFPDATQSPFLSLATEKSFPQWLTKRWIDRFGLALTTALFDLINTIPPITIRTNTLKTDRGTLFSAIENGVKDPEQTDYSDVGIRFSSPQSPLDEMPSFKAGWFQVQDEAAQLATYLMNPQPGEKILDACAGLGGKTGHMASLMKNRGEVVALDKNREKLALLDAETKRLGITIVTALVHDLNRPPDHDRLGQFDRVLLDAPCSGLGVLRRHPDTKWSFEEKHLNRYSDRQLAFLDKLAPLVKPAGILNYTICSVETEETDGVIEAFLRMHSDFTIHTDHTAVPVGISPFIDSLGCLRTYPEARNMDGFFSVNLLRS